MTQTREAEAAVQEFRGLERDLRNAVRGEVRFDDMTRALYTQDASHYRQVPIGVVIPEDADDIAAAIEVCAKHHAPVLPRGSGTSLAGQTCNVAVVIDASKYLREIKKLDPKARRAAVEPGVVLDDLRGEAERHGLTFGPDPSTHEYCTLGGMMGNNSCGVHALMGGKTVDNVIDMEIMTYDGLRMRVGETNDIELQQIVDEGGRRGEIYRRLRALRDRYATLIRERYPKIPRRVSGYNLDQLLPENGFNVARALVGSEGTCVTVLEATVRLIESPAHKALLVIGYPDVYHAADHVMQVLEEGPVGLEAIDRRLAEQVQNKHMHMDALDLMPEGHAWLLCEFGGKTQEEADDHALHLIERLRKEDDPPSFRIFTSSPQQATIWGMREAGLGATAHNPDGNDSWPGWEDSAVAPQDFGNYLRDLRDLMNRYQYDGAFYGHFGQGCLHTRIDFGLKTKEGVAKYRSFVEEAADLVVSYGGSFSGEHGDGQSRAELLPKMFGPELVEAFREFKSIWDPEGKMNPGKVVDSYRLDQNLVFDLEHKVWDPDTHFKFPNNRNSFLYAAERCVGVGKCRKLETGVMCPSYMATLDEQHSTRGRARALFEMTQAAGPVKKRWRSEEVKETLDLCLSCKACKNECPVNVDMATYRSEFMSHHYAGRLRPRAAYALGLSFLWLRVAARMPWLANATLHAPLVSRIVKRAAGIAPQRSVPRIAGRTLRSWFKKRKPASQGAWEVLLWLDTWNNFITPEVGKAAVNVLEDAGYKVRIVEKTACCGRPLYEYGMLNQAKRQLRNIADNVAHIPDNVPIVFMEPSCASVFRDELPNLFPKEQWAKSLSERAVLLSELLMDRTPDYQPPLLHENAVVHPHCHHRSVLGIDAEQRLLSAMGLDFEVLDSGCCGMAGTFGLERAKYDVSTTIANRSLVPSLDSLLPETLAIANGFSCREQITDLTDKKPLHVAQVLQRAIKEAKTNAAPPPQQSHASRNAVGAAVAALATASVAAVQMIRRG